MLPFKSFIQLDEQLLKSIMKKLYGGKKFVSWFDLDDTLVEHDPVKGANVYVNDEKGNRVETLSTSEFNTHVKGNNLKPGHSYDFKEFKDPNVFANSAHPIRKMINHAQRLLDNGHHVHIITARSDLEHPEILLGSLKQMGLDTSHPNFHLHRAGNYGKNPTHINKARMLHRILTEPKFGLSGIKKIVGYDDHKANVDDIHTTPLEELGGKSLRDHHTDKEFVGIHFTKGKVKRVS